MGRSRFIFGLCTALLLLVLAGCGGSASSNANQVNVTLSDFKIQSSQTTFASGTTYHFVVTNSGHTNHEFMIMPMGMNMGNVSMDQMHKMALAMIDTVVPGETKTIEYTYKSGGQKSLEFACHFPGHYEAGMHLPITVS